MGFRTVVVLNNDMAHEWQNDTQLGRKIAYAMNFCHGGWKSKERFFHYGSVEECIHTDSQTLAIVDSLSFNPVAYSNWRRGDKENERNLRLLKEFASIMGYRLVKED